jgi:hypothetical protein
MNASSFNSAIINFLNEVKFEDEHDCYKLEKKLWYASVIAICCEGEEAVRVGFLNVSGNRKINKASFNFHEDSRDHDSFVNRDTPTRWVSRNVASTLVGWLSLCHSNTQRTNMIGFIHWMCNNTKPSMEAYRDVIMHIKMNGLKLFSLLTGKKRPGEELCLLRFCEMWMREVVMKYGIGAKINDVLERRTIIDRNGEDALAKLSCRNTNKLFFKKAHDDKELCCFTDLFDDPNSQPVAVAEAGSEKGSPLSIESDPDGIAQGQEAYHPPNPANQAQQDTEAAIDTDECDEDDEDNFVSKEQLLASQNLMAKYFDEAALEYVDDLRGDVRNYSDYLKTRVNENTVQLRAIKKSTKEATETLREQATLITQLRERIECFENSNPTPEQDRKMAAKAPARDIHGVVTPQISSTPTRPTPTTPKMFTPIPLTPSGKKIHTGRQGRFDKASSGIKRRLLVLPPKGAPASKENEQKTNRTQKTPQMLPTPKISTPQPQSGTKRRLALPTQKGAPASSTPTRSTPTTPKISTPILPTQKGAPASSETEQEHKRRRRKNPTYDSDSDPSE